MVYMGKMLSSATLLFSCSIFLLLMLAEFAIWCAAGKNTAVAGCISGERKALLKFKASLSDPFNRLSSWNNKDCCAWQGVECDQITRHVIALDLQNSNTTYDSYTLINGSPLIGENLNSSLLELKHLSYLDLSWNDFQKSNIPPFLGSMKQLQHLNLSFAGFSGIVPYHLGSLSNLRTLDLSALGFVSFNDLTWASNLSSLEHLDLSYLDLRPAKDLVKVLIMLPSIVVLSLSWSGLNNTHLPHACLNFTLLPSIQHLDLSENSFDGEFPCFLQNMTSLTFLDLSFNHYNSSGNRLLGLKNISRLNLAFNLLGHETDWNSASLPDKCQLKSLDLSGNQFYGDISTLVKNLSGCSSGSLEMLSLSDNEFYGQLPEDLGELKQLTSLDISHNDISGPIPISLGKLSSSTQLDISHNKLSGSIPSSFENLKALRVLKLSYNRLSGEIPISLGQLSYLEIIDISFNSFNSSLSEAHFADLSRLENLDARGNMLELELGYDWVPPFQLKYLWMSSCKIGGQFPQWLQTQKALVDLQFSHCSIVGTLPEWLPSMTLLERLFLSDNQIKGPIPELPSSMINLDLSHNQIKGPIPELPSSIIILDLSDNMINHIPSNISHMLKDLRLARNFIIGSIPDSLCDMNELFVLDLSKNRLSGNLPECLWNMNYLQVARLSSNELSGVISDAIGGAPSLRFLHLNNNSFTGQLPSSLKNCKSLLLLDVGDNNLSGILPDWNGMLNLRVLRVSNNEFRGAIPTVFCQFSQIQVMDLANNKLKGEIPRCIGNFSRMVERDTSIFGPDEEWFHTSLVERIKGLELEFANTSQFAVNLDLSSNHLVGEIPSELTSLSALIGLNLSHNLLTGQIPRKIGDMKSLESLDLSYNNLSREIPESLSSLRFLSYLNLSNNNLSGQIPTGRQLQTLNDPSIYVGNSQLCGAPLPKKCHEDEASRRGPEIKTDAAEENDDDKYEKIYLYAFIIGGVATGFWGFIGVLVFKREWRQAYFQFTDVVIGKILGY